MVVPKGRNQRALVTGKKVDGVMISDHDDLVLDRLEATMGVNAQSVRWCSQ